MAGPLSLLQSFGFGLITSWTYDKFDLRQRNRIIFMNLVSYTGILFMAIYSVIAFRAGNLPLGLTTMSAGIFVTLILVAMVWFRIFQLAGWLITLTMAGLFGYLAWTGGEQGSGILWIQALPLIAMFLIDVGWGSLVSLAFLGFVAVSLLAPGINHAGFTVAYSLRVIGTYGYVWLFGLVYGIIRDRTEAALNDTNTRLSRTTQELSFEKRQTDGILKNVKEGIFLLDKDLTIGIAHSSHLTEIFAMDDLAGRNFLDVLKPVLGESDYQASVDWLPMLYGTTVNPVLLAEINPLAEVRAEFFSDGGQVTEKFLRFSFTRVQSEGQQSAMLAVVRDATEEVLLQRQIESDARRHQQDMEKMFQVIHVDPAMMAEFIQDTEAELESVNALLRDQTVAPAAVMGPMFQSIHGIKGNALLLGLQELARKVHGVEDQVKPFLEHDCTWKELLGLTLGLGMIQQELAEIRSLIDKIVAFQHASTDEGLTERGLLERTISRMLETEARRVGKPVRLVFAGFDSRHIPECQRKLVKDVLVQLIRNALIHGIELPDQRQHCGKDSVATITLSMNQKGDAMDFSCRDDGAGLDLEAIRKRAVLVPGMDPATVASLKPADLAAMVFRQGFSTAVTADLGSGRGAGMALVKNRVEAAGGRVGLKSRAGRLCEISFRLPAL